MRIKTKYIDADCVIERGEYSNGRPALVLVDAATYERQATATVNIPEVDCPIGHVFIKTYSENEGMLEALMAAGVVSEPIAWIENNYVSFPLCKLMGP